MKRMIAILMAVMMLTGVLTACSGTIGMDDGRAYGNVSTTPDGRVNGGGYENKTYNGDTNRIMGGTYGSNANNGGMNGAFGANGNSGTGMTGGR